jgi:hypothetical protein
MQYQSPCGPYQEPPLAGSSADKSASVIACDGTQGISLFEHDDIIATIAPMACSQGERA